jgi:uncharacterized protein (TIGR03435 family)
MGRRFTRFIVAAAFCALTYGQVQQEPATFTAVSIKPVERPNMPISPTTAIQIDGSRVEIRMVTLANLIWLAYRVSPEQIAGPRWMSEQSFDLTAQLAEGTRRDQVPEMLRALLAQRFSLATHREQRVVPVLVLTTRKNGAKLQGSEASDSTVGGCAAQPVRRPDHKYTCRKTSMADLARLLPAMDALSVDRPVVDETGLDGVYDFTLEWTAGAGATIQIGTAPQSAPLPVTSGPTISYAIGRLGVNLERQQRPLDILVVDHATRLPTEN